MILLSEKLPNSRFGWAPALVNISLNGTRLGAIPVTSFSITHSSLLREWDWVFPAQLPSDTPDLKPAAVWLMITCTGNSYAP